MLRGWTGNASKKPLDADESSNGPSEIGSPVEPPPTRDQNVDQSKTAGGSSNATSLDPTQDAGFFREWEAANRRYHDEMKMKSEEAKGEEENAETNAEQNVATAPDDPMASPGNSSQFSGWSMPAGAVDRESVGNPFDDDSDGEEDEELKNRSNRAGGGDGRATSPRQVQSKGHGLSMVKEEDGDDDVGGGGGKGAFDDVDLDLEAPTRTLHTSRATNTNSGTADEVVLSRRDSGSNEVKDGRIRSLKKKKASITDRVMHEFQTNPSLKYRAVVTLSAMLVTACLLIVVVASSSMKDRRIGRGWKKPPMGEDDLAALLQATSDLLSAEVGGDTMSPSASPVPSTDSPSSGPSAAPSTEYPTSRFPTLDPTSYPTGKSIRPTTFTTDYPTHGHPTLRPTDYPTHGQPTSDPSIRPTTFIPTYSPSGGPTTSTPTRDCNDLLGRQFMTYNQKFRDCAWLDNGHNGAKSARKDMNCPDSELGEACKYTCRLYNGCMSYLLSSLAEYAGENDVSVGDSCRDKTGLYMSNGSVPRRCEWLEEDPNTAPVKKNLNCGTRDHDRTELGIMCPGSCAGYNSCGSNGKFSVYPLKGQDDDDVDDPNDDDEMVFSHPHVGLDGSLVEDGDEELAPPSPATAAAPLPTMLKSDRPTRQCTDREGEFRTHLGTMRRCRWLNRDNMEEKRYLNCGITEIGLHCLQSCPCGGGDDGRYAEMTDVVNDADDGNDNESLEQRTEAAADEARSESCVDGDGEYLNHIGKLRRCRWFRRDNVEEKINLNCGVTEIGLNCPQSCGCNLSNAPTESADFNTNTATLMAPLTATAAMNGDSAISNDANTAPSPIPTALLLSLTGSPSTASPTGFPTFAPSEEVPTPHPETKGFFDSSMDILTLTALADATISQRAGDENFGVSKRLNVEGPHGGGRSGSGGERQSLILFDLTYVMESFGNVIGSATLQLYSVTGVYSGGVKLMKMTDTNWIEEDVSWNNFPLEPEPIIYSLESLGANTWINMDITDAVLEALDNNEPRLGIRLVADDGVDAYFASRDRVKEPPRLIVDSRTFPPSKEPTPSPTPHPDTKGIFDQSMDILSLSALADATVSQRDGNKNFGDSKRLNVEAPDGGGENGSGEERQSLILFDLSYVQESFGDVIGSATLQLYSVAGADSGGVVLKKMASTNWTEEQVTWNSMPYRNYGKNEPIIAFLDVLDPSTLYNIDVTAAVRDALKNNEPHLSVRISSEDVGVDTYFTSSERVNKHPPQLIVDSRTTEPTDEPSPFPTISPTLSPPTNTPSVSANMLLDCMDKKGTFITHAGEQQPCSWLGVGNGSLKRSLNCEDPRENGARVHCQAQCSEYNGCDDLNCIDLGGAYESHMGWRVQCSWLGTGQGSLKLEQNCGSGIFPITELGLRCQMKCGEYNGCASGTATR